MPTHTAERTGETLAGVLESIRFHKAGFLIGKLDDGTSVKGHMLSPQIGMEYEFHGRRERHPRWGETFLFSDYRASYPKDAAAIRAYLIENCRWVGPDFGGLSREWWASLPMQVSSSGSRLSNTPKPLAWGAGSRKAGSRTSSRIYRSILLKGIKTYFI